jgi:hypothetical protein
MSTLTYAELASRMWRVALLAMLCTASPYLLGQPKEDGLLWERAPTQEKPPRPDEVVSAEVVRIDVALLVSAANSRLTLTMPDGATLVVVKIREQRMPNGGFVWRGQIDGEAHSNVTLSAVKDVVVGTVSTSRGAIYRLRFWKDGLHLIERVDPKRYPAELEPREVRAQRQSLEANTCATDNGSEIDLLVVYTDDAEREANGAAAMLAHVNASVDQANTSYTNSNLQQQLRLVHVAKLDYDETAGVDAALLGFEDTANTVFAPVRAWRDLYGADIVALITQSRPCGKSNTMATVGNAFAASAISVVQYHCSTDIYTFGHELGHLMSARHDWDVDDTDGQPYAYNHGCTQPYPWDGRDAWRTIMAQNDACQAPRDSYGLPIDCGRKLQWSDPDGCSKKDAAGALQISPKTDNRRTLENTALTVANFRCSLPFDVWMRDTWNDSGAEPDPTQASEPMWKSPYIWVRNTPDPNHLHEHDHENPQRGQAQFIYVKLHNRGVPMSGTLEVYGANAATGLSWPTDWKLLGSSAAAIPALASTIVEVPWTPIDKGHYCLLARWVAAEDPMKTAEGPDVNANVRANNNIIWRNVNVVDLVSGTQSTAAFIVRNVYDEPTTFQLGIRRAASRSGSPSDFVKVQLRLSPELQRLWSTNGFGFRRGARDTLLITQDQAALDGFVLPPRFEARVLIDFERPKRGFRQDAFELDVVQTVVSDKRTGIVGGVTYDVRTNWLGR